MRRQLTFGLTLMLALAALVLPPWLAWREAERQAFDAETALTLGYARDVLHRTDETGRQALAGIQALVHSGLPPCSNGARELMREIDLTSTYLQAIGYVRDGVMVCSSMTGAPVPLGAMSFRTSRDVEFYLDVPIRTTYGHPLLAMAKDGYAVLIHRDLPLDIWTDVPDVSLAMMHLERRRTSVQRGHIDPAWLDRLGKETGATFSDGRYLVTITRSQHFLTAAIAATPISHLNARTREIAMRLVPAGLFAGLAAAAAVLLLARQQLSLVSSLRVGLRRNQFFLEYQPLIDLRSGHCVGVEALLRWRDGAGELVSPDIFIPVAESSGLIGKLTERVIELVCNDAGHFLASHPGFHVAINLSPADLRSTAIVGMLDRMMARSGALPSNVIVEITERGFVDKEKAREVIAALHARGIEVAIDDFGTGYSSLSYLESLDLDFLKIDRSFIESIGTGAPTSQVVSHIIGMAHNLELRMIAEGVENHEQAAFLRVRGVGYAQGWLFGHPGRFEHAANLHRAALESRARCLPQPTHAGPEAEPGQGG
ncbi:EAL domain-containing protein [Massilia sp. Bi118]|uniref:EAL domain-containing protein n=1 Tax=Massilia sp. Bi118 TaxID=2822346 RepID=UPI001E37DFF8|nr:EAL domain-containing protein [Massilia sp. Bi118]